MEPGSGLHPAVAHGKHGLHRPAACTASPACQNRLMNSKQRVAMALMGERPDRPPVSFWHHFAPNALRGKPAVEAHLLHVDKYQPDFLKVMNDTGFPRPSPEWVIESASDLKAMKELSGLEAEFSMELDIVRELRERLGPDMPMIVTVFNTWATMRRLTAPENDVHGPPKVLAEDERDAVLSRVLKEDPRAFAEALNLLGRGLAKFARRVLDEGADGIFLSVRDDWVDTDTNGDGTYDRIVMQTDLDVLEGAAEGWFNMLHVCGVGKDFVRFGGYPAHVINWADRYAGPSIAEAKGMTDKPLSGGVDNLNTLPNAAPQEVEKEVRDAIKQAGTRPILITPGCTYDPHLVSEENLLAMFTAAKYSG